MATRKKTRAGVVDLGRVSQAHLLAILSRTKPTLRTRITFGEMIRPKPRRGYAVADLLALIPELWDKISALRKQAGDLEQQQSSGREEVNTGRLTLIAEQARQKKRENDQAEALLVPAGTAGEEIDRAVAAIREYSSGMVETIVLELGLNREAAQQVEEVRKTFLRRVAEAMTQG